MRRVKKSVRVFVFFNSFLIANFSFVSLFSQVFSNQAVESQQSSSDSILFSIKKLSQDTYEDITTQLPLDAPTPSNVKSVIEYDPQTNTYILRTYVGEIEIATPFLMTEKEYYDYTLKKEMENYWREKNVGSQIDNEDKFRLTDMKFDIGPAEKVFGPGGVQVRTQGSAEILFGYKTNKIDNPALTERMRKTGIFDFEEKIQMNVNGKVGDKVNFNLNYNTESSFEFDQKMLKLNYKGKEDDIIKSIEAGNVSMPLNSSLIPGSSALFGIKTDLQFGKLSVSAIASQQEAETKTISTRGGAQTTKYEINIDNYDENRHFFLSHYFRNNYENAMSKLPYVMSGVTITRMEVWITNKRGNYEQARNIIAFEDLGETDRIDNPHWQPTSTNLLPYNKANSLYDEIVSLTNVRDIQQTNNILSSQYGALGIVGGQDYEKIESARKLDPSEYTFNPTLGYISLRNMLQPDEVLAVAFEYTYGGQTYQVGEFSTDPITAPNALIVKLLKSTTQSPSLPSWDLMMKNVYSLGATQIQPENFILEIVYRNDSVGTELRYITEGNIKNKLLLQVMNLDRLNSKNAPQPDGKFDYVEGYTIFSSSGKIFFPVLEPFGSHLKQAIGNDQIAEKYIFQELYDSTLVMAQEFSEKNKFRIIGEYKASSRNEIRLNAMNIPRGSVVVTAGGKTLVENVDYTVDYIMGTVNIINTSLLESGTNIDVKLENRSMFNMQRKTLLGTHLEYQFNRDFSLGGTIMHLSEMPLTTKVNTGNEPISNTIWGLNTSWRKESQWLTNQLDKLPFVNATKPSTIALNAEVAQLIPGHSSVISAAGLAYIDDFESTQTTIDIHYPAFWYLASTPYNPNGGLFPEAALSNNVEYGKNRALLAWYYVDPILNANSRNTPPNLRNNVESQSNHLTRNVLEEEIFPNKERLATQTSRLTILNLSYYPTERGPYNLDADNINPDGTLMNPQQRWGGIMRKLDVTDFETANIEYIEFWMMDPFIMDKDGTQRGGDLYFNLGDISEDILKDGKKFFEQGLPLDADITKVDTTVWGKIPKTQSTVKAFDNSPGARAKQDVGLDGLPTNEEQQFPTYKNYVEKINQKIDGETRQKWQSDPFSPLNDPAGDNYHFYRGSDYDAQEKDILSRYKYYNGTEGNSPEAENTQENYSTSATSLPDGEDLNGDNTMNEYEKYYQYHVQIKREAMEVGRNYITDKIVSNVKLENGKVEPVTWYQFKIPIREYDEKIGNIRNFKSIRFIRLFLTNFEQETHLRFATLDLVRGEWRSYTKSLFPAGSTPISEGKLDVHSVNIEEDADKTPVNYILPPGITRETDPGQPQLLQLNEQSMALRIKDLAPNDARAVYKNTSYDMRQYKRLQMFVHAEKLVDDPSNLQDYQLTCFIRLGSDMVNNYYEYEVPLRVTPHGKYLNEKNEDREIVWPLENMFDFPFSTLIEAKLKRDKYLQTSGGNAPTLTPYEVYDPDNPKNKIKIVGNPSISDIENIMIGIRNVSGEIKSGEIWVNELRMSKFNESGGWAAMGNLAVGLSDIGSLNFSGRIETAGYGSLESNVMNRRLEDLRQMNFSTALEVGRFLPEKAKLQIPLYFSYTNETVSPKYNPLNQDVELKDALENLTSKTERDSLLNLSQEVNTSKSFNISNARINIRSKKPQFYDPANWRFTYAYIESDKYTPEIEQDMNKSQRAAIDYSFNFNPQPWEPFKNIKSLNKPALKIINDFNIYYLPSFINFNTNLNRQYSQTKLRSLETSSVDISDKLANLSFSKDFMFNRQFEIKYDLTRAMKFSLQAAMNANIDEPYFTPEIGKEYYEAWRDTVWYNIRKLGTPYAYQQVFTASWNIPINKIPITSWIDANISYNSNYNWNRSALLEKDGEGLGNIATSIGSWQTNGQFNFEGLYRKSNFLKNVLNRNSSFATSQRQTFKPREYKQIVNLSNNQTLTVRHNLGSESVRLKAIDKNGNTIPLQYKVRSNSTVDIFPKQNLDSVQLTVTTISPNERSVSGQVVDFTLGALMMVRRVSFTYRESNSMVLTGFLPEAGFLGQKKYNGFNAPGYPFTFGIHDDNMIQKAIEKGWLNTGDSIVNPATTAFTSDFDLKASLEPIPGFKIDLNATRYTASNTSVLFMYEGMPTTYTGSFNITQIALSTAFKKIGSVENNYNSSTFNMFLQNRQKIADRLNSKYMGTNYPAAGFITSTDLAGKEFDPSVGIFSLNSPDVLIPAFLAAYTGKDASNVNTSPFISLLNILPNWRISYDGLSRIGWVKNHFKNINLTHGYTCRYSVGSYSSYSTWVPMSEDETFGYIRDVQTSLPIPSSAYDISSVSINEQFSPLLGINATMNNSMTTKLEYRKQRNLSLNVSSAQLIESLSDEYVIGFGYVLKDFDVILKLKTDKQSRIKNDLKLSLDLSYRDIKTLLRKIEENITQASSGNKLFTLKFLADYVFSSKLNIQLFYDRQSSTPLVSSSFPVSSSNFGVSFKFMLTR